MVTHGHSQSLMVTFSHSWYKATTDVYAQPGFNPNFSTKLPPMSLQHHGHSESLTVTHSHSWSLTVTHGHSWSLTVTPGTTIVLAPAGLIRVSVLSYHQCPCIITVTHIHSGSLRVTHGHSCSLKVTHGTKLKTMSLHYQISKLVTVLSYH